MSLNDSNAASRDEEMSELAIDMTLADSFPASDPPCWTLGMEKGRRSNVRQSLVRSEVAGETVEERDRDGLP
jgi:hypothetical protein